MAQGVPGRLRPWIFLTFRHYKGGRSSAKRTGRLYPRRNPWYSLSEAESTSGYMVLSGVPRKKSPVTSPGIDSGIVRPVAQRLNHYATPGLRRVVRSEKKRGNFLSKKNEKRLNYSRKMNRYSARVLYSRKIFRWRIFWCRLIQKYDQICFRIAGHLKIRVNIIKKTMSSGR